MTEVKFDSPAYYRIIIKGKLDPKLLEFMDIIDIKASDDTNETDSVIEIMIKDQAHLSGILNTFYDWHYMILKVECLENKNETRMGI